MNLDRQPLWAGVAKAMGAEGQRVDKLSDVGAALRAAVQGAEGGQDHHGRDDVHAASWATRSGATRWRCRRGMLEKYKSTAARRMS